MSSEVPLRQPDAAVAMAAGSRTASRGTYRKRASCFAQRPWLFRRTVFSKLVLCRGVLLLLLLLQLVWVDWLPPGVDCLTMINPMLLRSSRASEHHNRFISPLLTADAAVLT
jgi:hypothetical protein